MLVQEYQTVMCLKQRDILKVIFENYLVLMYMFFEYALKISAIC